MSSAGEGAMTPSGAVPSISTSAAQQYYALPRSLSSNPSTSQAQAQIDQPPPKKKRNLPGNPDPDAEVIALSPKSLMATNRFLCEICNKGFQRDQNLQLHRRGHNLPWKLKQRENKEAVIRKKVYVCPEPGCVHHDRSRALGDLTGIKKHYSRKHGEKKWKCDKCSKRYAVRSDWKAHSKVCGTKEYRCDCGTLFSRRDSFITHRAFCDALTEESTRSIPNPLLIPSQSLQNTIQTSQFNPQSQHPQNQQQEQFIALKQEEQQLGTTTSITSTSTCFDHHDHQLPPWLTSPPAFPISIDQGFGRNYSNPDPGANTDPLIFLHEQFQPASMLPSLNMSATALLQKAAQMGATMSSCASIQDMLMPPSYGNDAFGIGFGLTKDEMGTRVAPKASGLGGSSTTGGGNSEGNLTRDFLGLRPVSRNDIFSMAGIGSRTSEQIDRQHQQQHQNQEIHKPWQGN